MQVTYTNAMVFDGQKFVKTNFTVVNGKFSEVAPDAHSDHEVDLTGKFVTPGLVNAHTHMTVAADPTYWENKPRNAVTTTLLALDNLKEALATGVTFVRDVGSAYDVDLLLAQLDRADLPGIVPSGRALSMTGGHGSNKTGQGDFGCLEVDGPAEARKGARLQLKKGAKNIKVMATGGVSTPGETPDDEQLSVEEMQAAFTEAHHKGYSTAAHAQGAAGIKNAVRAGVDSVEHAIFIDDEAVELMKAHGTYVVPTLVAPRAIYENPATLPPFMVDKALAVSQAHVASFKKVMAAGIPVVMGTDAGTPFNNFGHWVVEELTMYKEAGMDPVEVLKTATTNAAKLLRLERQVGAVQKDFEADFVVLTQNPLEDFAAYEQPTNVYRKGKLVVEQLNE